MSNENVERARRSAARKLNPDVVSTSTVVCALIGHLLHQRWTYPYILSLACDRDGTLFAWESESDGHRRLIIRRRDLICAILRLAEMVDLTPRERTVLLSEVPPCGKKTSYPREISE
jgi:hypothetical protein